MNETDSAEHVCVDTSAGIMHIRMNRPEKLNALTRAMYRNMADLLVDADRDDKVRVIIISGAGGSFTAGNDLDDFRSAGTIDGERPPNPFLPVITRTAKPIIAAVQGVAVGIGTTMLLHCDLVYAGTSARLRLPFVNLGLCPELGSSLLLPLLMGHQRAAQLLLLGETFDAETARAFGLVNGVCDDENLLEAALAAARKLVAQPPASVRLTKALVKRAREEALRSTMAVELEHFSERLRSPEAAEALQAFAERRKPDFSHFV